MNCNNPYDFIFTHRSTMENFNYIYYYIIQNCFKIRNDIT